jgi:hypothetical protein
MAKWFDDTEKSRFRAFAQDLGVEAWTLGPFGLACCYSQPHRAWAFGMWDGHNHLIGIRLRAITGFKWTVTGTHAGIFVPNINPQPTCLICEGPTDTAAALSMGYYAVGRPSCSGGAPMIKDLIRRTGVKRAIIVADADDVGLQGAKTLIQTIQVPACILTLPCKDVRMFYNQGGDRQTLDALTKQSVWHCRK